MRLQPSLTPLPPLLKAGGGLHGQARHQKKLASFFVSKKVVCAEGRGRNSERSGLQDGRGGERASGAPQVSVARLMLPFSFGNAALRIVSALFFSKYTFIEANMIKRQELKAPFPLRAFLLCGTVTDGAAARLRTPVHCWGYRTVV